MLVRGRPHIDGIKCRQANSFPAETIIFQSTIKAHSCFQEAFSGWKGRPYTRLCRWNKRRRKIILNTWHIQVHFLDNTYPAPQKSWECSRRNTNNEKTKIILMKASFTSKTLELWNIAVMLATVSDTDYRSNLILKFGNGNSTAGIM